MCFPTTLRKPTKEQKPKAIPLSPKGVKAQFEPCVNGATRPSNKPRWPRLRVLSGEVRSGRERAVFLSQAHIGGASRAPERSEGSTQNGNKLLERGSSWGKAKRRAKNEHRHPASAPATDLAGKAVARGGAGAGEPPRTLNQSNKDGEPEG